MCFSHNGSIADHVRLVSRANSFRPRQPAPANLLGHEIKYFTTRSSSIETDTMHFVCAGKTHNWGWKSLIHSEAPGDSFYVKGNELLYVKSTSSKYSVMARAQMQNLEEKCIYLLFFLQQRHLINYFKSNAMWKNKRPCLYNVKGTNTHHETCNFLLS